jgi:hypothetical protein
VQTAVSVLTAFKKTHRHFEQLDRGISCDMYGRAARKCGRPSGPTGDGAGAVTGKGRPNRDKSMVATAWNRISERGRWCQLEKGWHAVRGAELQALLADRDLGYSVHYAHQFHRGGRLTGAEMGKKLEGTWKVTTRFIGQTRRQ